MSDDNGELGVSVGPGGVAVRSKGYRLMDVAWGVCVAGIVYIAVMMSFHDANAGKESAVTAEALKQSNATVAAALKEANANTVAAIQSQAAEQKKTTRVLLEAVCLLDPAMKGRSDARDLCKRMARLDQ